MEEEPDADDEDAKMCKMAAEELKKEKADFAKVVQGMYAKMCKMSAKMTQMAEEKKAADAEMAALKEFKANSDTQEKEFAVNKTISELEEKVVVPEDARAAFIADAANYSLADIETWKNVCKAKSFDFAVKPNKEDKGEKKVTKIGLPFSVTPQNAKKPLWVINKK